MPDPSATRILIVDDDASHRRMLALVLSHNGFVTEAASDGEAALAMLETSGPYDFVLLDMRMPGLDGLATLQEIDRRGLKARVLVMTAYAEVRAAVETIKLGAVDYITKPLDMQNLVELLKREAPKASAGASAEQLPVPSAPAETGPGDERFGMYGRSASMREVFDLIERVAPAEATILIQGESGTGKELVAKAIHSQSRRHAKPLVSMNCAALPEPLLESELFGHVRGAFTGAERDRPGRFQTADKGTLFLDEIGEMPLAAQAKLLRVMQDGTFEPVGSSQTATVDVRLIAATNKNLALEAQQSRFRQDLYYRLNTVTLHLPPLRERPEDIDGLADRFVRHYARKNGKPIAGMTAEFQEILRGYAWPGNVRELENLIERCVILARSEELTPDLLPRPLQGREKSAAPAAGGLPRDRGEFQTLQEAEQEVILRTLDSLGGNQTQAAKRLGISRQTLINKLKQYREAQKTPIDSSLL